MKTGGYPPGGGGVASAVSIEVVRVFDDRIELKIHLRMSNTLAGHGTSYSGEVEKGIADPETTSA